MSFRIESAAATAAACLAAMAEAQTLTEEFQQDYALLDLGSVETLPTPYGGLTFLAGDPDTLLLGGSAANLTGAIYAVPLERGCTGHVVGFAGPPVLFATAPRIDGGLAYGPDGVLFFTQYPFNQLGQIRPGSSQPDKTIDLTALGVSSSVGTLQFTPPGYAGAGSLKLASFNASNFYDAELVPDGAGTFDLANVTLTVNTGGGPEGLVYVDESSPQLSADSVLISMFTLGSVVAYEADANGDPVLGTNRPFITGLTGAEGAAIDPLTGDFLFSTYGGGNRVIVVRGFVDPCRADFAPDGGDGNTGVNDLLALLGAWGQSCVEQDINEDTVVNVLDLLTLLSLWGPCE